MMFKQNMLLAAVLCGFMLMVGCSSSGSVPPMDPKAEINSTATGVLTFLDQIEKNPKMAKDMLNQILEPVDNKAKALGGDFEKLSKSLQELRVALHSNSSQVKEKIEGVRATCKEVAPDAKAAQSI